MSRGWRLVAAPWRLALAVKRKGARPVAEFLLHSLKARGTVGAFKAALLDRNARPPVEAVAPVLRSTAAPSPPQSGFGLDPERAIVATDWARFRASPASVDAHSLGSSTPLAFVVQGEGLEAREVTTEAIKRIGGVDVSEAFSGQDPQAAVDQGQFVVFLRAGDRPCETIAPAIASAAHGGVAEVVSFDLYTRDGDRVFPLSFPGPNPTLLRTVDYLFGRVALRGGALGPASDGESRPRARLLAWMQRQPPLQLRGRWRHIGLALVEAAINQPEIDAARAEALRVGRQAVQPTSRRAAVIICTKDRGFLLEQLVRDLLSYPASRLAEIVIVANGTTNAYALHFQEQLAREPRIRLLRDDRPFNFSRLCNDAARGAPAGADLLFLNDDVAPVTRDWLERLLQRLDDPVVGATGPLLLYPDESVQHAGMFLGFRGVAGHTLRHARLPEDDYLFMGSAPRETSAVTGAVLMVRREAFEALGGFDVLLPTLAQDVDLCIRLRDSGWTIVFDPTAVLLHMESVSILRDEGASTLHVRRRSEAERFHSRWADGLEDPLHPALFDTQGETLRSLRPEWLGASAG